jgi:hypothetical protein
MADIRTLKLNLLADTANFRKGLNGARKASDTFAGRVGLGFNKVHVAMAAVAASMYGLINIGSDLVRSAQEDEAGQAKLAQSLKNTTKATDAQIASAEKWITTQQRSTGFTDTSLRNSLARLTNSTKDVTKSQELLSIAMDASRGTGKDLETVTGAIAKAYDGNYGALKRLGVPLDDNLVKMKDTQGILQQVADLYGGQASTYADTFAGKMAILNTTFQEFKEKVGTALIEKLTGLLPYIQGVVDVLAGTGKKSLAGAMSATTREAAGNGPGEGLGYALIELSNSFGKFFDTVTGSNSSNAEDRVNAMANAVHNFARAINLLASAWGKLSNAAEKSGNSPFGLLGDIVNSLHIKPYALGGVVPANKPMLVGERGPEIFTPNGSGGGRITPNGGVGGTTIIMNGIVDGESARRSIERLLQQSARRSGAINLNPVLT